jgi:hypothetical protein
MTEMAACWKYLPNSLFFYIMSFVDTIDIRRAFKMPIRRLKISDEYKQLLDTHLPVKQNGYIAKYLPDFKSLHVLSYYIVDDDFVDEEPVYSHKIYRNINFNQMAYGNTYFQNICKTHTEVQNRYLVSSKMVIYVRKALTTDVVISGTDVHNLT